MNYDHVCFYIASLMCKQTTPHDVYIRHMLGMIRDPSIIYRYEVKHVYNIYIYIYIYGYIDIRVDRWV